MYYSGLGIEQSYSKAFTLYKAMTILYVPNQFLYYRSVQKMAYHRHTAH